MQSMKQYLDNLMGANRNGDNPDAVITDFRDKRVCTHFLCGLCPHDLFGNTKSDLGVCEHHHSEDLKKEYEERVAKGRDYGYNQKLRSRLEDFIREIERKIEMTKTRTDVIDNPDVLNENQDIESTAEMLELTAKIQETLEQAEKLGEEGEVDESMELTEKAEELKDQKKELEAKIIAERKEGDSAGQQKLRVCEICGAMLSIHDSDKRLADHFGGKVHLGYLQIRTKLDELKVEEEKRREKRLEENKKRLEERKARGDGTCVYVCQSILDYSSL
eukprot:TRINITY_DN1890_c0_g1_i3.p1 TRINITY_DN1890_c0_g1~~TRINITY_DN1890_c0_g1_i3.p1  ORF type:complete len:275 (+),score=93.24 TRINITY_DN1890_c0_g1_i3:59-883(+)